MNDRSLFMEDDSEGNYGKEAMLDFQMSWLMRISTDKRYDNTKLGDISRYVVLNLLELDKRTDVVIKKVKVWKQRKRIDVIAEIEILVNGNNEQHLVVIEDKIYHGFSKEQLDKNSSVILNNYDNPPKVHYWLIYGNSEIDSEKLKQVCREAKPEWKPLWFYDVIGGELKRPIGNGIFDDFWVRKWV